MSTTCKHLERAAIRAHRGQQWPPKELMLPDTIAEIEAGRPAKQRSLFPPDDSREGRLRRLSSPPRSRVLSSENRQVRAEGTTGGCN